MSITQKQAQKLTAQPLQEAALEELAHYVRRCRMVAHYMVLNADDVILHSATHLAVERLH